MSETIAITNVKIFDGNALTDESTVVIENGVISDATTADRTVDGQHGTLLPGFIDSHVHLLSLAELEHGTQWGVTTMLDMGSPAMALTNSLRHRTGVGRYPRLRKLGQRSQEAYKRPEWACLLRVR